MEHGFVFPNLIYNVELISCPQAIYVPSAKHNNYNEFGF